MGMALPAFPHSLTRAARAGLKGRPLLSLGLRGPREETFFVYRVEFSTPSARFACVEVIGRYADRLLPSFYLRNDIEF